MRPSRFFISVISIKHRLPLLIGALLLGIIMASTWTSYIGVKESSLDVGRERLQNLTKQLANLLQQSNNIQLTKTFVAANDPAIKSFLRSPAPATRSGASVILRQLEATQDTNTLQIELWNINRSLVLSEPDGASPQSLDLEGEFKAAEVSPFKTVGAIRVVKDVITAPAVVAVNDDSGKPIGYLVRWRRMSISPTPKALTDLLGSEAALYFGNIHGDLLTNLERITSKPRADMGSTSEVMQYSRDGNRVLALGRPIVGTPWFLVIEFPEQPLLEPAHRFLKRVLVADLVLFIIGMAGAIVFSRGITQPLQVLTEAASAIGSGDYSRTVEIHQDDELGALANAFNAMVTKTQDVQQELERKVQERTADITERKAAEERLKISLNEVGELKTALDEHAIVAITDPQGKITYVNDKFCAISKYSRAELIGQDHRIINSGHHSKEFIRDLWTTIARGRVWHGEIKNKAKDGSFYWVDTTIVPFLNEQGKPRQYVAIRADITARKQAEEKIHQLNAELEQRVTERTAQLESTNMELEREVAERLSAEKALSAALEKERVALNNAVDVICTIDADGKFVSVNPACQQLWGYSQEELIGRQYIDLVVPEDVARTTEASATIMAGENATDFENRYRHKDGSQVHVMWTASWSEEQQLFFSVARDISRRHLDEEKLKKSAAELERSNSELQDFASVASHDLQEPLRKIQSFADELKVSMGNKIEVDEKDTLDRIIAAGERMRTLINDLLSFSRVTSMAKPFAMVNLNLIVKEVLSDLEARIKLTKGLVEVSDLPTIDADPMQIYQLLQNLIGNGLKFHAPGVAPVIKISGENGGPDYRLSVTDNGIGFDEKYLDRIFTVFQRLHGRKEYEGTGIGLAICRKIAERHGGQITAQSAPGAGSTFTVTLPLKQSNEEKP